MDEEEYIPDDPDEGPREKIENWIGIIVVCILAFIFIMCLFGFTEIY